MSINFVCTACGKNLKAPIETAGKKARCGKCGAAVTIPGTQVISVKPIQPVATRTAPPPPPAPVLKPGSRAATVFREPPLPVRSEFFDEDSLLPMSVMDMGPTVNGQVAMPQSAGIPAQNPQPLKECPFCGELILEKAKKCKHCLETLDVTLRAAEEAKRAAELSARNTSGPVSSSANTTVVYQQPAKPAYQFPHGLHLILTILTMGVWLPIWIIHWLAHEAFG